MTHKSEKRRRSGWLVYALGTIAALGLIGLGATTALIAVDPVIVGKIQNRIAGLTEPEAPPRPDAITSRWTGFESAFHGIERTEILLGNVDGSATGGAIDQFGDTVVYVSANGQIGFVDLGAGTIAYADDRVPMRYDEMRRTYFDPHVTFNQNWYRVADILIRPDATGQSADLFVSHHLFLPDTEDMCLLVSRRGLVREGGKVSLDAGGWDEVYRIRGCIHLPDYDYVFHGHMTGGRLIEAGDGDLLLSVGSFALGNFEDDWHLVQPDADNDLSKIIRIAPETGSGRVHAAGFRNPQGLARDPSGRLWESEHGAQSGDEVNLIVEGGDYGWPNVSMGFNYGNPREDFPLNPVQGEHRGYRLPALAYVPAIAVSQIVPRPADTEAFPLWKDDLLLLTLKDKSIRRLRPRGDAILYDEPIPLGHRLRDGIWLSDGRIALLTGDHTLLLLRDPETDTGPDVITIAGYDAITPREEAARAFEQEFSWGRQLYSGACASCHGIDGASGAGPALNGVVGAKIGSMGDYGYSDGLAEASGTWTRAALADFINNPEATYPGSSMPAIDYLDQYEMEALLDFLEETER